MKNNEFKSGFIGISGWTNVGKSTLVNRMAGQKITITADRPQTTRNKILGFVQGEDHQIVLVDTPGIHRPKKRLSHAMIQTAWSALETVDVILWMVFPDKSAEFQYEQFRSKFENLDIPIVVVINKVDLVERTKLLPLISQFESLMHPAAIIPISARKGDNLDALKKTLVDLLPAGLPLYPKDDITDRPERFLVAEFIREYIISYTFQEIPHSVVVEIESFTEDPSKNLTRISATIYVEKNNQKGILIGKNGEMLKKIGTAARRSMEELLHQQVDLQLWVKVVGDWRDDQASLHRFGIIER